MAGRSCTTTLGSSGHMVKKFEAGENIDIIYFNFGFAQVFETVPHHRLLRKLEEYGVKENIWIWLREYFKQEVVVNGENPSCCEVTIGILQGK